MNQVSRNNVVFILIRGSFRSERKLPKCRLLVPPVVVDALKRRGSGRNGGLCSKLLVPICILQHVLERCILDG